MEKLIQHKHKDGEYTFCVRINKTKWRVGCEHEDCPVRYVYGVTEKDAIEKWNNRRHQAEKEGV